MIKKIRNSFIHSHFFTLLLKFNIRLFFIFFWICCLIGFLSLSYISRYFVPEKSLSIYMWADKIDESVLQQFEKETGIKIYVNYYESNEELITKFEIAKDLNCDIILPSEYIIKSLIEQGFIKKINKSECNFIDRIYPEFLNMQFDPNNEYSLPIYWDVLGLGYNTTYFDQGLPAHSWNLIFNQTQIPCKEISMIDDSREAIFLSLQYFKWDYHTLLNSEQIKKITNLFLTQKSWVGAYTDFQQGYFLRSKTYPLVVSQRERIIREKITDNDIEFIIPDEGSLLFINNIVISSSSQKDALIYQFLNYIYDHQIMLISCKEYCLLPTVKDVLEELPEQYIHITDCLPGTSKFDTLHIFPNILTQKQINDIWIAFKSF